MNTDQTNDEGSISILVAGFVTMLLMVLLTVAAAASVHIAHKQLQQLADAAAGDAADALDRPTYYTTQQAPSVPITDSTVLAGVQRIVAQQPVTACTQVQVVSAVRQVAPERAQVQLRCIAQPPFISALLGVAQVQIPITVTSAAQAPTRP